MLFLGSLERFSSVLICQSDKKNPKYILQILQEKTVYIIFAVSFNLKNIFFVTKASYGYNITAAEAFHRRIQMIKNVHFREGMLIFSSRRRLFSCTIFFC